MEVNGQVIWVWVLCTFIGCIDLFLDLLVLTLTYTYMDTIVVQCSYMR